MTFNISSAEKQIIARLTLNPVSGIFPEDWSNALQVQNAVERQYYSQILQGGVEFKFEFVERIFSNSYRYGDKDFDAISLLIYICRNLDLNGKQPVFRFEKCNFESIKVHAELAKHYTFQYCNIERLQIGSNEGDGTVILADSQVRYTVIRPGGTNINFTFKNTDFIDGFDCSNVIFKGRSSFTHCSFGAGGLAAGSEIEFSNVTFVHPVTFEGSSFYKAPKFFDAKIPADCELRGCRFFDVRSTYAWRTYRTLKHFMMRNESDHETLTFHALELEARYNSELPKGRAMFFDPKGFETICSFVLKNLTDYGRNLSLPFVWLLIIADLFLMAYAVFGGVGCADESQLFGWVNAACSGNSAMGIYAVRNAFGPVGFAINDDKIIPNTLIVKGLGFAQLILSSIIWFLWALQIRARFKL